MVQIVQKCTARFADSEPGSKQNGNKPNLLCLANDNAHPLRAAALLQRTLAKMDDDMKVMTNRVVHDHSTGKQSSTGAKCLRMIDRAGNDDYVVNEVAQHTVSVPRY